ncbi:hypothetical protein HDV05_006739 [Chytridiales sp. JEL 0842]|nr:hypothetical protein HDV05_006739 [Chytridiales sp. JEL 0842]
MGAIELLLTKESSLTDPDNIKYVINATTRSAKEFLVGYDRGAYTAARTVNKTHVMDLAAHINRLAESLQKMRFISSPISEEASDPGCVVVSPSDWENGAFTQEEAPEVSRSLAFLRNPVNLGAFVKKCISVALRRYHETYGTKSPDGLAEGETKVTVLLTYSFKSARVKDSAWVNERKAIEEKAQTPGISEVLLADPHGNIYEGLTSNFLCVALDEDKTPAVFTAPQDHVLQGTILRIVLKVCEDLGVRVKYQFPRTQESKAFIDRPPVNMPAECKIIDDLREGVLREMVARATPVFD